MTGFYQISFILLFSTVEFENLILKIQASFLIFFLQIFVSSKKLKFEKFEIKKDPEVCRANISYEAAEESTVYIFRIDFEILQQIGDVLVNFIYSRSKSLFWSTS